VRPLPARQVGSALEQKGFTSSGGDHVRYHFYYKGKDVGVATRISHGEKEIGVRLAAMMRKQMKLSKNDDFMRFVECPMSKEEYEEHLRALGIFSST
jgi:predicted RNA binding protein YcfA (HicA-like mRNA interferase family)